MTYCFASSWVASENDRQSRLFSIPRRARPPPRAIYCSQVLSGKEENEKGTGRRWSFTIILWCKPCAICTSSFDRCRDLPYVSCVSCLRSSLTCPSYKLTREWLHARNAQVKNCFLLARSPHNLSSCKRRNQLGTRKKKKKYAN